MRYWEEQLSFLKEAIAAGRAQDLQDMAVTYDHHVDRSTQLKMTMTCTFRETPEKVLDKS